MNLIKHDTNPGDLVKVQIPKRFEVHVNKAIADSVKLLTIQEFIQRTDFELDVESFDVLYFNINDELPVYLSDTILNWMGYEGETKTQKLGCLKTLSKNFTEGEDFFIYKNSAYKTWRKTEIKGAKISILKGLLPRPATGTAARSKKHIVIMPDVFKLLVMMLKTKNGRRVREYYISLEKLIKAYIIYQCEFLKLNYLEELQKIRTCGNIHTRRQSIKFLDIEITKKYKVGCVYFIQEELTRNIKIGWCWNLPRRLETLQVGNSQKLVVVKHELTQFPHEREKILHGFHEDHCIRGEWYSSIILQS